MSLYSTTNVCMYLSVGYGAPFLVDLVTDLLSVGNELCCVGEVTLLNGLVNTRKHRVLSKTESERE